MKDNPSYFNADEVHPFRQNISSQPTNGTFAREWDDYSARQSEPMAKGLSMGCHQTTECYSHLLVSVVEIGRGLKTQWANSSGQDNTGGYYDGWYRSALKRDRLDFLADDTGCPRHWKDAQSAKPYVGAFEQAHERTPHLDELTPLCGYRGREKAEAYLAPYHLEFTDLLPDTPQCAETDDQDRTRGQHFPPSTVDHPNPRKRNPTSKFIESLTAWRSQRAGENSIP